MLTTIIRVRVVIVVVVVVDSRNRHKSGAREQMSEYNGLAKDELRG